MRRMIQTSTGFSRFFIGRSTLAMAACLLLVPETGIARQGATGLEHFPVVRATAGQPVTIKARLAAGVSVPVYVRVYYRQLGNDNYRFIDMQERLSEYEAAIPASAVTAPAIQYFVIVMLPNRSLMSRPAVNPYGQPYEISVQEAPAGERPPARVRQQTPGPDQTPTAGVSEGAVILSPEPMSEVPDDEVTIAAGFFDGPEGVDSSSVRVYVDGVNFTNSARISPFLVTLTPRRVASGAHRVRITASTLRGEPLQLEWRFFVVRQGGAARTAGETTQTMHRGRVYAEVRQEEFSNQKLDANSVGANINGSAGPFGYTGQAYVTTLEDQRFQPRNRFSLNLRGPLVDFGIGDQYPYYNNLILWGRRVRGFDVALKLGSIVKFQFATGQTNRRIPPTFNATTNAFNANGGFQQNLKAGRVAFGGGRNFQFGLTLMSVRDEVNSLNPGENAITPQDNIVGGADFLLAFDKRRVEFKAAFATSLLTRDITNGPSTKADIDRVFDTDIPIDPADYRNWLIINESTTPLDPTDATSMAYNLTLRLNYLRNFIRFGFKRIGSAYLSLGQTYLRNNVSGWFINDRVNLFGNKVFMNLGIENYQDNFNSDDGGMPTDLTTFNYGLALYPGSQYPVVNFGVRNYVRDNNINNLLPPPSNIPTADSLDTREQSISRDFNFGVSYGFNAANMRHTLNANLVSSRLIDEFNRANAGLSRDYENMVQSLALRTEFAAPVVTVLTYAFTATESNLSINKVDFELISGRLEYRFLNDQITVYTGARSLSSSGLRRSSPTVVVAAVDYTQTSFQFGGYLTLGRQHKIIVDADLIKFNDRGTTGGVANPSFDNHIVRLFYEFRFGR